MTFAELWDEYHNTFGEWFPTMCFPNDSGEETCKKMEKCLRENKKAEVVFNLSYTQDISY